MAPPHQAFPLAAAPLPAEDAAQRAAEQLRSFSLHSHKVGSLYFCSLVQNKIVTLRLRLFLLFKIYKVYMFNGLGGCVIVFVHINCRSVKAPIYNPASDPDIEITKRRLSKFYFQKTC